MQQIKDFCFFFLVQFTYYALIAFNYRAVAQAQYAAIAVTDLSICVVSFTVIKKVARSESRAGLLGYALGGACGALVSVFFSRKFFGQ